MNRWGNRTLRPLAWFTAVFILMGIAAGCATTSHAPARKAQSDKAQGTASQTEPNVKTLYAMARILRAQGKRAEEEIVLRRVLAKEPRFVPAYADLAEVRMHQHLYADAVKELNEGLAIAPDDPVLLNDLGVCAVLQKNYEEALGHFSRASEVAPRETRYRANKALALGLLGQYVKSEALYRETMSTADAAHNLTVIKRMRGETCGEAQVVTSQEDLPPTLIVPEVAASEEPTP